MLRRLKGQSLQLLRTCAYILYASVRTPKVMKPGNAPYIAGAVMRYDWCSRVWVLRSPVAFSFSRIKAGKETLKKKKNYSSGSCSGLPSSC